MGFLSAVEEGHPCVGDSIFVSPEVIIPVALHPAAFRYLLLFTQQEAVISGSRPGTRRLTVDKHGSARFVKVGTEYKPYRVASVENLLCADGIVPFVAVVEDHLALVVVAVRGVHIVRLGEIPVQ